MHSERGVLLKTLGRNIFSALSDSYKYLLFHGELIPMLIESFPTESCHPCVHRLHLTMNFRFSLG